MMKILFVLCLTTLAQGMDDEPTAAQVHFENVIARMTSTCPKSCRTFRNMQDHVKSQAAPIASYAKGVSRVANYQPCQLTGLRNINQFNKLKKCEDLMYNDEKTFAEEIKRMGKYFSE